MNANTPTAEQKRRRIVAEVAERHGVEVADLMGKSTARYISNARMECFYRIKTEIGVQSFPVIGRFFDRHHTTILYGFQEVKGVKDLGREWPIMEPAQSFDPFAAAEDRVEDFNASKREKIRTKKNLVSRAEARLARLAKEAEKKQKQEERAERIKQAKAEKLARDLAQAEKKLSPRFQIKLAKEQKLADQINAYWHERGKRANAVVVVKPSGAFSISTSFEELRP